MAAGKMSVGQKAHHLVEIADPAAANSRAQLERLGVSLNSAANGVGLTNHAGRHSTQYSTLVGSQLARAKTKKQAENTLERISREIKTVDKEISEGQRGEKMLHLAGPMMSRTEEPHSKVKNHVLARQR